MRILHFRVSPITTQTSAVNSLTHRLHRNTSTTRAHTNDSNNTKPNKKQEKRKREKENNSRTRCFKGKNLQPRNRRPRVTLFKFPYLCPQSSPPQFSESAPAHEQCKQRVPGRERRVLGLSGARNN